VLEVELVCSSNNSNSNEDTLLRLVLVRILRQIHELHLHTARENIKQVPLEGLARHLLALDLDILMKDQHPEEE